MSFILGYNKELKLHLGKSDVIRLRRSRLGFQYIEKCDFRADLMSSLVIEADKYADMCTYPCCTLQGFFKTFVKRQV